MRTGTIGAAVSLTLAALMAVPAGVAVAQQAGGAAAPLTQVRDSALAWTAVTPPGFEEGMELAVVRGDPSVAGEQYVIRLRFPDGYRFPPHWHPVVENVTVLEGTLLLTMGEKADESRLVRYHAGDYLYIQPRHPHFGGAMGKTMLQLHGAGPFAIITVGTPEDSVRTRTAASGH